MRLFRLERAISAATGVLITGLIVSEVSWSHGFAALSVFFSALANFVLNDLHDLQSDSVNGRQDRPLALGVIGKNKAVGYAIIFGILATSLAFLLPESSKILILIGLPFTLAYNIYLKRYLFLKNLFTGLANMGVVLVGASITRAHFSPLVVFLAVIGFLFSFCYEVMLDIADVEGDRVNCIETIPVRFGVKNAVRVSVLFGVATMLIGPLPFLINLDKRLFFDPLFLLLVFVSVVDRGKILWRLREDQRVENVMELKVRLFRNLQISGLCYLLGILV